MSDDYLYDTLQSFGVHAEPTVETAELSFQRSLIAGNMPELSESTLREIQELKRGDVPINSSESDVSDQEEVEAVTHPAESDSTTRERVITIRHRFTTSNVDCIEPDSLAKDDKDGETIPTSNNHIRRRTYFLAIALLIVLLIGTYILITFKQPLYLNVFQPFKRWVNKLLEEAKKVADRMDHAEPIRTPDVI